MDSGILEGEPPEFESAESGKTGSGETNRADRAFEKPSDSGNEGGAPPTANA
jgi:hypothetical protein